MARMLIIAVDHIMTNMLAKDNQVVGVVAFNTVTGNCTTAKDTRQLIRLRANWEWRSLKRNESAPLACDRMQFCYMPSDVRKYYAFDVH